MKTRENLYQDIEELIEKIGQEEFLKEILKALSTEKNSRTNGVY